MTTKWTAVCIYDTAEAAICEDVKGAIREYIAANIGVLEVAFDGYLAGLNEFQHRVGDQIAGPGFELSVQVPDDDFTGADPKASNLESAIRASSETLEYNSNVVTI
jgi:hypothetical protein